MKTFATILLPLYLFLSGWEPPDSVAQVTGERPLEGESVVLKWLGTAGWEIQIGRAVILIDPFLTRGEANLGAEWKTDEASRAKGDQARRLYFRRPQPCGSYRRYTVHREEVRRQSNRLKDHDEYRADWRCGQITTGHDQRRGKAGLQRVFRAGDRKRAWNADSARPQGKAEVRGSHQALVRADYGK